MQFFSSRLAFAITASVFVFGFFLTPVSAFAVKLYIIDNGEDGHMAEVTAAARQTLSALGGSSVSIEQIDYVTKYGATGEGIASAITEALDGGANVINLSLVCNTSSCTTTVNEALDEALRRSVTVIASAGNSPVGVSSFARRTGVIGVSGLFKIVPSNRTSAQWCTLSDILSAGTPSTQVDFYTPATSNPSETNPTEGGSSISAPRLSAIAAVLLSNSPSLTPAEVESRLRTQEETSWGGADAGIYVSGATLFSRGTRIQASGGGSEGYCIPSTQVATPTASCTLSANPATLPAGGGTVSLTWSAPNATAFSINQNVGAVTPVTGGSRSTNVAVTTTYTGTSVVSGRNVVCSATVTVASAASSPPSTATRASLPISPPATTVRAASSDPLDSPIVPTCEIAEGGGFVGACQLCDLVKLARNIINFSIAFSVIVATLLFAYAGFMYFTAASSPDNIKKAHGIFTKTLGGIVIILASWLVINLLMITVSGNTFSLSDDIECGNYPTSTALPQATNSIIGGGRAVAERCANTAGVTPNNAELEASRRTLLGTAETGTTPRSAVTVNNAACPPGGTSGCTNIGGLTDSTIQYILRLARNYPDCALVITGGSEGGHCTHNTGKAFDLRANCTALNEAYGRYAASANNGVGGGWWLRESDHWHVCTAGKDGCQ
jgi:hypothetical protein